jgi:hypothetical protein
MERNENSGKECQKLMFRSIEWFEMEEEKQ